MSNFSNALASALKRQNWKRKDLSEKTGIQSNQISKYVTGALDIGFSNLDLLLEQFPVEERGALAKAWLLDHIPKSSLGLVTILIGERIQEIESLPSNMDPELRDAVLYLAKKAVEHREIRDVLVSLKTTLTWQHKA